MIGDYNKEIKELYEGDKISIYLTGSDGQFVAQHDMTKDIKESSVLPKDLKEILSDSNVQVWRSAVFINGSGLDLGTDLWIEAELNLLKSQPTVLRYVRDKSNGGWTTKKLPEIIKRLGERGIKVHLLWQGQVQGDNAWLYELN